MSWGILTGPRALAASVLFAGLALTGAARADIASAEALFREGRDLLAAGKVAEACAKFAESQRQDPSPGTLLNLASCHAKQGKAASAWAEFLAARRAAQTAGRTDLADEAQKQADQIAPLRSYLTLIVEKPVQGLKLMRNGEALDAGSFGSKLPSDPGRYTIVASAPGYLDWQAEVVVEGGGDDEQLRVPELEPAPPEEKKTDGGAGPATSSEAAPPPPRRSLLPFIVGGAGVAVTGAGLVFGALAKGKYTSATDACPTLKDCGSSAMDDRDSAETFANVSNVAVGVGLAAVATGVVLLLVQGKGDERPASALRVSPSFEPGRAGAFVSGAF